MSGFSMYARSQMLSAIFANDLFVVPTEFQIALTHNVAAVNAPVASLDEPTTGGYVRQTYPAGSDSWELSGFGELYNLEEIQFPEVLVSWGLISGWVVIDPNADECIDIGGLLNPFIATAGMLPKFAPGTITVGLYDI